MPKLKECTCCAGQISTEANACPHCGHAPKSHSAHHAIAWFGVWIMSIISLVGILWALVLATGISAPQQAAIIAGFIGITVAPYCYARAVEKF